MPGRHRCTCCCADATKSVHSCNRWISMSRAGASSGWRKVIYIGGHALFVGLSSPYKSTIFFIFVHFSSFVHLFYNLFCSIGPAGRTSFYFSIFSTYIFCCTSFLPYMRRTLFKYIFSSFYFCTSFISTSFYFFFFFCWNVHEYIFKLLYNFCVGLFVFLCAFFINSYLPTACMAYMSIFPPGVQMVHGTWTTRTLFSCCSFPTSFSFLSFQVTCTGGRTASLRKKTAFTCASRCHLFAGRTTSYIFCWSFVDGGRTSCCTGKGRAGGVHGTGGNTFSLLYIFCTFLLPDDVHLLCTGREILSIFA